MAYSIKAIGAVLLGGGLLLASAGCSCSLSRCGGGFIAWGERSEQLVPGSCSDADGTRDDCPHGEGCTDFGCRRGLLSSLYRGVQRACWRLCPDKCHTCGRARHGNAAAAVVPPGTQSHSRYHPLPTQPVFSPRVDDLVPMADEPIMGKSSGATQVQPTAPMPPESQEPPAPNAKADERTTRAPRPLATPSSQSQRSATQTTKQPSSWVFSPSASPPQPPAPEPELPLEPKDRLKSEWKAVRR
jgi:hypothetical protein